MTALTQDLVSAHMPPLHAQLLGINLKSLTATGTTQGTPLVYAGDWARLTATASATAATVDSAFPVGAEANVMNITGYTALLYPPSGCNFNAGTTNAAVRIAPDTLATVVRTTSTIFRVSFSASPAGTSTVILGGATDSVTAAAGGGQVNATALTGVMSNVTVVATAADSVKLPLAQAGMVYLLRNSDAADSMQVFGAGTDTINGVAYGTGVAQAAGKSALYFAITSAPAGKWFQLLSA